MGGLRDKTRPPPDCLHCHTLCNFNYPINLFESIPVQKFLRMSRQELVARARILEQIDRYDDMIVVVKQIVALGPQLSVEERNLLSVAYKNGIAPLRTACRALKSLERKEEAKNSQNLPLLRDYKKKTQGEIVKYGLDVIDVVDKSILPHIKNGAQEIFFQKLKADYYRYLTECTEGEARKKYADQAAKAYEAAYERAKADLKPCDPTRLGLALNYSVFFYEIQEDVGKAVQTSKKAFDDGIAEIDQVQEDHYKEVTTILQLLRDNLSQWVSDAETGQS